MILGTLNIYSCGIIMPT